MGSGKSLIATMLATETGVTVFSLDNRIIELAGKDIAAIFAQDGESTFRALESQVLAESLEQENVVIDTGGGVIEAPPNRALLTASATDRCYLATSLAQLGVRITNDGSRPMLAGEDVSTRLATLLARREKWYREVATLEVNAGVNAAQVVASICAEIG